MAALVALLAAAGCGERSRHYHARGVVEDVQPEIGQVLIAHEEIEGLMPAMTMNFDVPDAALLERLERGQAIDFEVEFTGKAYRVTEATVRESGVATGGGGSLGAVAPVDDPAPPRCSSRWDSRRAAASARTPTTRAASSRTCSAKTVRC